MPQNQKENPPVPDKLKELRETIDQMFTKFQDGFKAMSIGQFDGAMGAFQEAHGLVAQVRAQYDAASVELGPLAADDPCAEGVAFAAYGEALANAHYTRCQGFNMLKTAEFGIAGDCFTEAAKLYDQVSQKSGLPLQWLASFCNAYVRYAAASKYLRDGNRAAGLERLVQAIRLVNEEILPKLSALEPPDAGAVLLVLASFKIDKLTTELLKETLGADFDSALNYSEMIHNDLATLREQAKSANLPPEVLGQLDKTLATVLMMIDGLEAYALASKALDDRQWEIFDRQLKIAKRRLMETREASLELKDLAAISQQATILDEILIEPARRRAEKIKVLCNDLARLEADLKVSRESYENLAVKAGGPQIINNLHSNTENQVKVEVAVEINLIVANFFEDRTRDALSGLRTSLLQVPEGTAGRAELMDKLETVTKTPRNDPSWFEKARHFASDAAKLVGDIAKVAKPVGFAWNLFAPLFGMPPIPLPLLNLPDVHQHDER